MKSALIVIDMLNEYDHEDAEVLVENVRAALPAMCAANCSAVGGTSSKETLDSLT